MAIAEILQKNREEILRLAERHGALEVRVFGSMATDEATADSDVDFLVKTAPATSSWFPVGLIQDLEDLLGRKVEVVTEKALHRHIKDKVLQEARPL